MPEDEEIADSEFDEQPEEEKPRQKDVNLEKLVSQPTWKEILLDLVVKEQLDPWNIDICQIADKFLQRVKGSQTLDLHVPANLILAASILLRFKSDAVRLEEEEQVVEGETFIGEDESPVEIPMLSLRTRIPPKRKVTLDELVHALEEVFDQQKRREDFKNRPVIEPELIIQLPEFNLEKQMAEMYEKIQKSVDSKGLTTFSQLVKDNTRKQAVYALLPLLFLAQNGKVNVFQEKFFGEIFVQLLEEGETPREAKKKLHGVGQEERGTGEGAPSAVSKEAKKKLKKPKAG